MAKPKVSLRPSDAETGLLSDEDVTIVDALFTTWQDAGENALVGGREGDDPCLKLVLEREDSEDEEPYVQYLSAGKANRLVPSEDGEEEADEGPFVAPAEGSNAKGLGDSCNANIFLKSAVKPANGKLKLSEAALDNGVRDALSGMRCHLLRVPQPKRAGLPVDEDEEQRQHTVLTVSEIYELPGKKTKAPRTKAGTKKKVKTRTKPEPEEEEEEEEEEEGGDDAAVEKAEEIITSILESKGEVKVTALAKLVFPKASKAGALKKEILALVKDQYFLGEEDRPWMFDGTTLSAIEEEEE